MGDVKIRYYVTRQRPGCPKWGYWAPTKKMKKLGFALVDCGEDGPAAWTIAHHWNGQWDAVRKGKVKPVEVEPIYPPGSVGEGFAKFKRTQTWLTKKPRTREDWERGWKHIAPIFGDVDPRTIGLEEMDVWYNGDPDEEIPGLLLALGVREAHRVMKIWRALWKVIATIKKVNGERYCDRDADPSLGIRRKSPKARNALWFEGEAVRLVKQAWRMGFRGLAAALAVSWDTMLSPVDVRGLTDAQRAKDGNGPLYFVERAKTGKSAIGTVSARTERLVNAYIESLPFTLHPETPIFHTRGGEPGPRGGRPRPPAAYTKDTLSKDFRIVRQAVFPGDTRKVSDFRRSGAVEATAGEVNDKALAGKMANSIDTNRELQKTYTPHNTTLVRMADAARSLGRKRLRGANGSGSKS